VVLAIAVDLAVAIDFRFPRLDRLEEERTGPADGITIARDRQHLTRAAIDLDLNDQAIAKVVETADEVEGVSGHGKSAFSVGPTRPGRRGS